ncbi:hypothetical protein HCG51_35025 (plasmid) [Tolypothrix sp. PCC 7910]|uniref:hypothetical protein n=1 Tax=Tolypothrix sp. PCC 7910 TaxID=2099387 RepID=UPI001427940E|nr:hypothetical protein [Tolypothrix sp. PCC 7910]QIR41891.1 hypothetical protein HCG51_35025 [Tolypothrix sp. PCC 7910]
MAKNMNLFSHYNEDFEEFVKEHGYPIDRQHWSEPLVPSALDLAKNLFHGAEIEEASDGSILVALDNGSLLALTCLPDSKLEAFATRFGKTYFITVKSSVVQLLFNLALAIWKDQRFLSHIRPGIRDITALGTDFIPPGFEEMFLFEKFRFSDEIRHTVFYHCFKQAVSFFWLHETAHVLAGHLDICAKWRKSLGIIDEFLNAADFDDDESEESIHNTIPYHAFEIHADRWALDRLFGILHQQIISDSASDIELISTAIGCTLFPLSLHGYNLLQNKSDIAKHHPPLWFRADEVIYAEDKAANDQRFKLRQGEKKFELLRFRQKHLVQLGLAGLSRLHPMFADWLSPVAESSRQAEAKRVLDEANVLFDPWRDDLSRYCRGIKMRASN